MNTQTQIAVANLEKTLGVKPINNQSIPEIVYDDIKGLL
jgi:hypothetical protein